MPDATGTNALKATSCIPDTIRVMKLTLIVPLLICAIFTACGGGSGRVSEPPAVAPTITTQPQNQTVTAGQTATFTVVASGSIPLSYQWKKNDTDITNATSSTYTTPVTTTSDDGARFSVRVSNTAGNVTSNSATLAVNAAGLTSQTITFSNPGAQKVGTPLTLTATASSGLAVSFASTTTPVCEVSGTTTTFVAIGTCTIRATQAGNSIFAAATPVTQSFAVNAASPVLVTSISIPSTASVVAGSTTTLTPAVQPSNATNKTLTWNSSDTTTATVSTSGVVSGIKGGTITITARSTDGSNITSNSCSLTVTTGGALRITTTSCPAGTQGSAYSGCTISAAGGTPPYMFSVDTNGNYPPLPEGMSLNASTGVISSSQIGGQGTYMPLFRVQDSASTQATKLISFAINGNNAFLTNIFPSTSIFHHRVDTLPVDTSPAAPIYSAYLTATIKPFFGNHSAEPFPNGIPAISVPYNQPNVAITTTVYQSYFTSGPIPANAPVEGTSFTDGDRHVLVYRQAGGTTKPALYEMWQGIYQGGEWTDSSNALWPDVSTNALTPQGNGTSDAAGLPVGPLLVNADEVMGTGTPTAPNGSVRHPIRFTLNHILNYWVWPATATAGVGSCTDSGGNTLPTWNLISQSSPPAGCTMSSPAGEIYRLKASVPTPSCASSSPQAAIIITGFRNYGIIVSDNGQSGGLIGTPDARWNDDDLDCLRSLTLADFEPVNVSSIMVSADSGATK